jgi:hypothetical protein
MAHTSVVRPPCIAIWLVDLFAPYAQADAISGDLQEEFSGVAAKSGIAFARRWFWRQSARTIADLISSGFRDARWSVATAVVVGFVLLNLSLGLFGLRSRLLEVVVQPPGHNFWPQAKNYLFWLRTTYLWGSMLYALLVGCFVAMAAKSREMTAAIALSLVFGAVSSAALTVFALHQPPGFRFGSALALFKTITSPIMIVSGAIIVRKFRSAHAHRLSSV